MPKPILYRPSVMAGICQRVAAAVPEHVGMHLESEASALPNSFNQPIKPIRCEGAAPLGGKDEAAIGEIPPKLAQCPDLVAAQRMHARLAVLGPSHMQRRRSPEFDLR